MTDAQGSFRLVVDPQRLMEIRPNRAIWAYSPGRTVGVQRIELAGTGVLPPVRLTLAAPFKRTLTISIPTAVRLRAFVWCPLCPEATAEACSSLPTIGWSD